MPDRIEVDGGLPVMVLGRPDRRFEAEVIEAMELPRDPRFADVDDATLERDLRMQAGEIAAATCRWLLLVAELVVRRVWAQQGAKTPSQWLSWAVSMAPSTAREHVRVALRLRELPKVVEVFSRGELSYSKVRAITRVATPELEDTLLEWAAHAPASQIEQVVTDFRLAERLAENSTTPPRERRSVSWRYERDGTITLKARYPVEDGEYLIGVLTRLAETLTGEDQADREDHIDPDSVDDTRAVGTGRSGTSLAARRADALRFAVEQLAQSQPADVSGEELYTLVVHADHDDLTTPEGEPTDAESGRSASAESLPPRLSPQPADLMVEEARHGGSPERRPLGVRRHSTRVTTMSREVLRRLACDCGIVLVTHDRDGHPIDAGRATRRIGARLRRALLERDHHCRFPGCPAHRRLQAHHIRHWADGGPTDLANLLLLCRYHHRVVHRDGWRIDHDGRGHVRFHRADGRVVPPSLPLLGATPLDSRVRNRCEGIHPQPDSLQPHWDGTGYDRSHAVAVLQTATDRYAPPHDVAVAA